MRIHCFKINIIILGSRKFRSKLCFVYSAWKLYSHSVSKSVSQSDVAVCSRHPFDDPVGFFYPGAAMSVGRTLQGGLSIFDELLPMLCILAIWFDLTSFLQLVIIILIKCNNNQQHQQQPQRRRQRQIIEQIIGWSRRWNHWWNLKSYRIIYKLILRLQGLGKRWELQRAFGRDWSNIPNKWFCLVDSCSDKHSVFFSCSFYLEYSEDDGLPSATVLEVAYIWFLEVHSSMGDNRVSVGQVEFNLVFWDKMIK